MHYEPGYAYPLVVWLHSDNSSEVELQHVMPHLSTRNYVAVAPRGGRRTHGERNVFSWTQDPQQVEYAADAVSRAIETAKRRLNVNSDQVFLAGYGGGGAMALRLALLSPEDYRGVVSINGPMPRQRQPLGRINDVRDLPLMLVAGLSSQSYPEEELCSDLRLLHAAGMRLHVVQIPCGDDLDCEMLKQVNHWIMGRVCPAESVCS